MMACQVVLVWEYKPAHDFIMKVIAEICEQGLSWMTRGCGNYAWLSFVS